jgi:hypothetical protein
LPNDDARVPGKTKKLCKRVGGELTKRKIDFKLDCAKVADSFRTTALTRPEEPKSPAKMVPCHDVVPMQPEGSTDGSCSSQVVIWRLNVNNLLMGAGACLASPLVLDWKFYGRKKR